MSEQQYFEQFSGWNKVDDHPPIELVGYLHRMSNSMPEGMAEQWLKERPHGKPMYMNMATGEFVEVDQDA